MNPLILSAVLIFSSNANANSIQKEQVEKGAQTIVDTYNKVKENVGITYDLSAGPKLACLGKLFVTWAKTYDRAVRSVDKEVASSTPVVEMRRLASEVENDSATYEEFINGLLAVVSQSMETLEISAPTELTVADVKGAEYYGKLQKCRSTAFYKEVVKNAQASNVNLSPQTLSDDRFIEFLSTTFNRR